MMSLGWTPLHYAANDGHSDTVKLVMGADVNIQDSLGKSILLSEAFNLYIFMT